MKSNLFVLTGLLLNGEPSFTTNNPVTNKLYFTKEKFVHEEIVCFYFIHVRTSGVTDTFSSSRMSTPCNIRKCWTWSTNPTSTWWKGIFNPDLEYELSSWTDRPTWTVKLKCWVCLFNLKVSTQSWVKIVSWQFVSYGCFISTYLTPKYQLHN